MDDNEFNPDNYKLAVGQVWVPDDTDDYNLEIIKLDDNEVTVKDEMGDVWEHELDGSDGFQDFLYWNGYTLKKI